MWLYVGSEWMDVSNGAWAWAWVKGPRVGRWRSLCQKIKIKREKP